MTSAIAEYFTFVGSGVKYNFIVYLKTIDGKSYQYKFYDIAEKTKLEIVKFFHHFHIIKEMDLNLKD